MLVAGVPPSVLHRPSDPRVSFHSFSGGLYKGVVDFVLWKGVVKGPELVGGGVGSVDCKRSECQLFLGGDVGVGEGERV